MDAVLRRDRLIVIGAIAGLSGLSWLYLFHLAGAIDMKMCAAMASSPPKAWGLFDLTMLFVMWSVMMVAMMLPSAAPMIMLFARVNRQRREQEDPLLPTMFFLAAYLVVWTGFSAAATFTQWGLHRAALLSPMMVNTSPVLGAVLLIGAGIFQWTPFKAACLVRCRSPLAFVLSEWRDGRLGVFIMGFRHGQYCLGCCWMLMALLFVAGVMNLLWIASIAVFVLVEKALPRAELGSLLTGAALIGGGILFLIY